MRWRAGRLRARAHVRLRALRVGAHAGILRLPKGDDRKPLLPGGGGRGAAGRGRMREPGGLREAGLPPAPPAKAVSAESVPALPAAPPTQGRMQGEIVWELEVNTDLSRSDKSVFRG